MVVCQLSHKKKQSNILTVQEPVDETYVRKKIVPYESLYEYFSIQVDPKCLLGYYI